MRFHNKKTQLTKEPEPPRAAGAGLSERLLGVLRYRERKKPEPSMPGLDLRCESYAGQEGAMNALLAFGQSLTGKSPGDVYLCLGGIDAISDDEWGKLTCALFRAPHRYHIALPAPDKHLAGRPFEAPGEISVYELPKETEGFHCLLCVPGLGAVAVGQNREQSLLIRDDGGPGNGLFSGFLPKTKPVAWSLDASSRPQDALERLQEQEGRFVLAKDNLNGFFVPPDLLPEKNTAAKKTQADCLERHRKLFVARAKGEGWVDVIPRIVLEAISLNQSCRFSAATLFGKQELVLRAAPLRAALQTMLGCLDLYPNYRVVWTDTPQKVWTALAASKGALLCDFAEPGRFLYLDSAYGCFGLEAWADSLPRDPDRGRTPLRKVLEEFPL